MEKIQIFDPETGGTIEVPLDVFIDFCNDKSVLAGKKLLSQGFSKHKILHEVGLSNASKELIEEFWNEVQSNT